MKLKNIIITAILMLTILLSACTNTTANKNNIFEGEYESENSYIKVEVLVEDNYLKHIELLESNNEEMQEISVYLFEEILKNGDEYKDSYINEEKELFLSVEIALENAGVSFNDLLKDEEVNKTSYTHDVVIVGAGGAGLTAAIEAKNLGYENVVILEKMSFAGGNTRMSNGSYAAPDNWNQSEDIKNLDSSEIFLEDLYNGGANKGDIDLLSIIAENSLDSAYWLKDEVGVDFLEEITWYEGHTYTRNLRVNEDGIGLITALLEKASDVGVEIFYNTTGEELIIDENGVVTGVIAKSGSDIIEFNSNTGVILATGGFGANTEMLREYSDIEYIHDEDMKNTNSPAINGDGILMAESLGAMIIDMDEIQFYPITNPATGNFYKIDYARLNDNAILVNINGERFTNEHNTRDILAEDILNQPKAKVYGLIDEGTINRTDIEDLYQEEIKASTEQGVLFKGTLSECSEYFNIPYEALKNTIDEYNLMAQNSYDNKFNRDDIMPIEMEEFIMFEAIPSIHHTMGGVKIDEYTRVLNENNEVIKGLFAAGEVVGGIYGENRLGAAALPEAIVFGRIAAQNIEK